MLQRYASFVVFLVLLTSGGASQLLAHCQVPCGIYGDELKFGELEQHVATIEKAAAQIVALAGKKAPTATERQQLIRWTMNKEDHAQAVIDEAANYFLAQRIKSDAPRYAGQLQLVHEIIVAAMKTKQGTDAVLATTLMSKIVAFKKSYLRADAH